MPRPLGIQDDNRASYPATLNQAPAPHWLKPTPTYDLLVKRQHHCAYGRFVLLGNNSHTT